MHCDTADIVAHQLDLARVQTAADLEPEVRRGGADGERASDPSGRSIEGRQEIVAPSVDFAARGNGEAVRGPRFGTGRGVRATPGLRVRSHALSTKRCR